MVAANRFEHVEVSSQDELRDWLAAHHARTEGVWLVTFKKHRGAAYVSTSQVLDELLCFGWIDGRRRKLDDDRTMQLITPRRAQHWAATYKARAQRLIDSGRMQPPGLAAIAASKAAGLWNFLDDVDALIKPDDLAAALDAQPSATANFDRFPAASQRFVLRWIKLAKRPATRARRIAQTAELASKNQRIPGS